MNSFLNEKTTQNQTELDIIRLTNEIYNLIPSSPAKNILQAELPFIHRIHRMHVHIASKLFYL